MTVSEFVRYYLFEIVLPSGSVKSKTLTDYQTIYENHIKCSSIENIKLVELKKEQLQKYFNNLLKTSLKLSTVKNIKVFISTILNYAVNEDYIVKNHCSSIKLPKNNELKQNKYLKDEEINLIFKNCNDSQLLLIIKIALSTGMRINEILALTENDFDFNNCSINVDKTLSYCKVFQDEINYENKLITTPPKSISSIRKNNII